MANNDEIKIADAILKIKIKEKELRDEIADLEGEGLTKKQKEKEITSLQMKYHKQMLEMARKDLNLIELKLEHQQEIASLTEEELENLKKQKKILEETRKEQEKLLRTDKEHNKELEKSNKGYISSMNALHKINSVLGGITNQIKSVIFGFDEVSASISKTSSTGAKFFKELSNLTIENQKFAIGQKETAEQFGSLFDGMNEFTKMSQEQRGELVRASSIQSKFGVSAQNSARSLDILTKTLGLNNKQAITTQSTLTKFAKTIGLSANRVAAEFNSGIGVFARYGKEGVEQFKKLLAQSKATGIGLSSLLDITGQFDTFEGAAEAAGKLNAILGGGVFNSTELLNASEEERIKILKEGIAAQGLQWDSMNKFQRMAVMNASGIKSMEDANRLFGETTTEEMKAVEKAVNGGALSTSEIEEQIKNATSITDQFKTTLESFGNGIKDKVIPFLRDLVSYVREFIAEHPNVIKAVALIAGGFAVLGKSAVMAQTLLAALSTTLKVFGGSAGIGALATLGSMALAIVGVGAAAYEAYTNWDLLKESFRWLLEDKFPILGGVLEGFKELYSIISRAGTLIDDFLENKLGKFYEYSKALTKAVINPASFVADSFKENFDEIAIPEILGGSGYKGSPINNVASKEVKNDVSRVRTLSSPAQRRDDATNQSLPEQASKEGSKNLILQLDGRELGRAVLDVIEEKMNLSIPR